MKKRSRFYIFSISLLLVIPPVLSTSLSTELDALLKLSLEELTNVQIVSASKIPQRMKEVPATVRVITSEEIKKRGYFTLDEALADLPGMQFRNINGLNSYVFMRGVPSQNNLILVLIDGVQVNELNSGGFYGGAQYNLSNVDRIEIVYGPASALYGTNAISGIIHLITKSPERNTGLDLNALIGTFNTMHANISCGYRNDDKKYGFRFSGMAKSSDKADLAGEAGDNNWTEDLDTSEEDVACDARFNWRNLDFGLNYLNKRTSTATNNRSVGTIYRDTGTLWNIGFLNAHLKVHSRINAKSNLFAQIYYRNSTVADNSVLIVTDTAQVGYYRPNDLFGFESNVQYHLHRKINLLGGVVFETENLAQGYSRTISAGWNIKPPKPVRPEMENNTLASVYGQMIVRPISSLELYAGARFDNSSVYDRILTPRTALVYNKNKLTAKLLYTEAFRAPKPWDYSDGLGNSDLKPEEMTSVECDAGYSFLPSVRAEVSVYRNQMTNLFVKQESADSWRWINYGKVETIGFEMNLTHQIPAMQSYCNYSFNHSTDENDDMLTEISEHHINAGTQYYFTNQLNCTVRGNYIGKRKNNRVISATGNATIDAALIVHATINYIISRHFDIQISAKNLFDTEYYHPSNLIPANLTPDRYRQPQRTLMLQAGYHFK